MKKVARLSEDRDTWKMHEIQFPRYDIDISTERRTLFHLPIDAEPVATGDGLILRSASKSPRCKLGVLTDVRKVRLREELDADLGELAAMNRDEYLARWDTLHPELSSGEDPTVWRVAFCYVHVDRTSLVRNQVIAERGMARENARGEVEQLQDRIAELEAKIANFPRRKKWDARSGTQEVGRKKWDAERSNRGNTTETDGHESADYVDGWNDAISQIEDVAARSQ